MPLVVNEPKCPRCESPVDWSLHRAQGRKRGIVAIATISTSFGVAIIIGAVWGIGAAIIALAVGMIFLALTLIPLNQAKH